MRQVKIWINSAPTQSEEIELARILAPIVAANATVHQDLLAACKQYHPI